MEKGIVACVKKRLSAPATASVGLASAPPPHHGAAEHYPTLHRQRHAEAF
ncbi:MAG: hypothetical protein IJ620_01410 [Bacteroidales bacterium]|nr:hypothetical protein [Bacteroidales bacterium]